MHDLPFGLSLSVAKDIVSVGCCRREWVEMEGWRLISLSRCVEEGK